MEKRKLSLLKTPKRAAVTSGTLWGRNQIQKPQFYERPRASFVYKPLINECSHESSDQSFSRLNTMQHG